MSGGHFCWSVGLVSGSGQLGWLSGLVSWVFQWDWSMGLVSSGRSVRLVSRDWSVGLLQTCYWPLQLVGLFVDSVPGEYIRALITHNTLLSIKLNYTYFSQANTRFKDLLRLHESYIGASHSDTQTNTTF